MTAIVNPTGSMNVLSSHEVSKLQDTSKTGLYSLFRRCALAVLNCDSEKDNAQDLMAEHENFNIHIIQEPRGLKLELINAPRCAFVNKKLILGVKENLFSVLRDILYVFSKMEEQGLFELNKSQDVTNLVFEILRHAQAFDLKRPPNIVVCWGGHAIGREEYTYTKVVGYNLGLYGLDICTGCGPGAMKGPMKGAYIGHAKQRIVKSRFIGLTEPDIIAAESPNPIVNELVIMPDIEKRLEAFIRLGHGIVIFPGGPGTAEEVLYILGVLLHEKNQDIPFPLIFTGPSHSADYFQRIDTFIGATLGQGAQSLYQIIVNDPPAVAEAIKNGLDKVTRFRRASKDAYHFNWKLTIDRLFQEPFEPTHEAMANLTLSYDLPPSELAANLRRAMSGIVAGNIKENGIKSIEQHGLFNLSGDQKLMQHIDELLSSFVAQHRMKLPGSHYKPCYVINNKS
ncbi:MAG: LOG family protein [Endozoicomonadaceae bacterium]|nr:LOG family protein [Endozoicomonadaceae bacterium]